MRPAGLLVFLVCLGCEPQRAPSYLPVVAARIAQLDQACIPGAPQEEMSDLIDSALEGSARLRRGAKAELLARHDASIPALIEIVERETNPVRREGAVDLLSELAAQQDGKPDPWLERALLRKILGLSAWQLRNVDEARAFLLRMGGLSVPGLILGLEDQNLYVRSHSIELLGALGPLAAKACLPLLRTAQDPFHRADAFEALGKLGAEPARARLSEGLSDANPEVRAAARRALESLDQATK